MSIENNLRVASAKAKGDIATLMQMAGQGDITAAAALKQLKDKQDYMKSLQRNTGIQGMAASGGQQMDSQNSVIANLAQSMEMPEQTTGIDPSQSGIGQVAQEDPENSYAEGGAVQRNFEEGGEASAWGLAPAAAYGAGAALAPAWRSIVSTAEAAGSSVPEILSQMGKDVRAKLPKLPKSMLGKLGIAGALGETAYTTATTDTADYRKRFGMDENESSLGGDLLARGLGAASDLGNAATFGYAGNFFRDKQDKRANPPPAKAAVKRPMQPSSTGVMPSEGAPLKATGIAAATGTPDEGAASASGPGARLAVPKPGTAGIAANADTPLTDAEKQIAALAALSEEGRQLTAAQQKMLDDAQAAYTKRGAGTTWGKVMDFANRLSASKGSDNLSVFGEAGRGMREADKAKGEMDAKQQQAYESATLLLKQADLAARKGDINTAAKLRADAKEMMGKQETERTLNEYRKALAEAAKDRGKAAITTATRPRATKATATGVKPMTEAQRVAALDKLVKGGLTEEQAAQVLARRTTMPGNVTPDATTGKAKFLEFE